MNEGTAEMSASAIVIVSMLHGYSSVVRSALSQQQLYYLFINAIWRSLTASANDAADVTG